MQEPSQKLSDKIDKGVKQAVREAIEKHRRLGQSISFWKDGQIITLVSDEIPPLQDIEKVLIDP